MFSLQNRTVAQKPASARRPFSSRAVHVRAQASSNGANDSSASRRQALAGLAFLSLASYVSPAQAYRSELCVMQDTDEAADACRKKQIDDLGKENYSQVAQRKGAGAGDVVQGVPVSVLDSEYVRASKALIDDLEEYCAMDPYNKERIALSKKLKTDGLDWVSKYARGGSARSESARRLYIAVDGAIGFLASNGLAPIPKAKANVILATAGQAKALLAEGK